LCVRQICLLHKKVLLPCLAKRTIAAVSKYREIEHEMRCHEYNTSLEAVFDRVSRLVWGVVMHNIPYGDIYAELKPRHGPGTTAEGRVGNSKFLFTNWPQRLESCLPFSEFGIGSIRNNEGTDRINQVAYLRPRDELPVKVVLVPKTLKTPRVIAVEPVCMQYMQQAIADWIRPVIELHCPYTKGRVNFTRQDVNARLAFIGSKENSYATLDLSDASDRVSCKRVARMLRSTPVLRRYVFACRSTRAILPDGGISTLRKFASMGSALCFPIEAMAFFIAIVSSRIRRAGVRPTPGSVARFSESVFVYGDDLIVPNDEAPTVVEDLETFGFKVNTAKSFWTGKFRESCGRDYYDGVDVTPVYFRRKCPDHRADVHGLVSAVSFANQIYLKGYWKTARVIRQVVERLLGPMPSVARTSQVLGWHSFSNAESFHSWDKHLQRPRLRGYVVVPKRRHDPLDGDAALLKCFGTIGQPVTPEHLRSSVRFGNLALKRRWI
jgi:hypothetical protein